MQEFFSLPRALVIIQTIFGAPLAHMTTFRAGDIENLTANTIGKGNYSKTLDKLIELNWIRVDIVREQGITTRRPSQYLYSRTNFGRQEYNKLRAKLAPFGIHLQ